MQHWQAEEKNTSGQSVRNVLMILSKINRYLWSFCIQLRFILYSVFWAVQNDEADKLSAKHWCVSNQPDALRRFNLFVYFHCHLTVLPSCRFCAVFCVQRSLSKPLLTNFNSHKSLKHPPCPCLEYTIDWARRQRFNRFGSGPAIDFFEASVQRNSYAALICSNISWKKENKEVALRGGQPLRAWHQKKIYE